MQEGRGHCAQGLKCRRAPSACTVPSIAVSQFFSRKKDFKDFHSTHTANVRDRSSLFQFQFEYIKESRKKTSNFFFSFSPLYLKEDYSLVSF
jgi:hypothetical protein